jgi:hypothetical protein
VVVETPAPVALPPVEAPYVAPVAPPMVAAPIEAAPAEVVVVKEVEEPEASWADSLSIGAFVDAYGAIRSDNNGNHGATAANSQNDANSAKGVVNPGVVGAFGHDAYVQASGFALAFAGVDVSYSGDQFGATISLRFGPGVNRFYGADQGPFGIDNVTQAYLTWKPTERLTLDLGQFYTLFGAEVAESWRNQNYSRGALYYAMQPFWHTGLRANYKFSDSFAVNAMVVNGVNTAFEGGKSPTLGLQLVLTPIEQWSLIAGYMTGLHPRTGDDETIPTKNFQDFIDVVSTVTLGDLKIVMNADINSYRPKGFGDREQWWGVSFAPGYAFTDWIGAAARVEYLVDSANAALGMGGARLPNYDAAMGAVGPGEKVHLTTLTGTLDLRPSGSKGWLILRPEFRYEMASADDFTNHDGKSTKNFWSAHLGAVVTSMK